VSAGTAEQRANERWASQLLAGASGGDGHPIGVITNLLDMVQLLRKENEQLQGALTSRIAIEQAKGRLAERFDIDPEGAFVLLRRAARSSRVKLRDLAEYVAASRETPPEISDLLEGWERRFAPTEHG
jgi:hypothetical protein